jgi:DNA-directed RNA polymerase specialized sigma24 family protein
MPSPAELLPPVYAELRRLAAVRMKGEPSGHSLDATALVHEVFLKLGAETFASKSDFVRVAATAMRRVLIDHARERKAQSAAAGWNATRCRSTCSPPACRTTTCSP